ncbi:MAG: DUF2332 domain-containing protein [Actinomycetota bacterium]
MSRAKQPRVAMMGRVDGADGEVAESYRLFAHDAKGSSPTYERLALAVAADAQALQFLAGWEAAKQNPMLLFGALRWYDAPVVDPAAALRWLADNQDRVRAVMTARRTQTNEAARCATLLPALGLLPQPLALIELGASAGLCMLYDEWRYHYTGADVDHWVGAEDSPVTLHCAVDGPVPLPDAVPTILWRAGLDLNPIDAADPDARRWLEALVWPEHHDRAERLRTALDVAARKRPRIDKGDIARDLPRLLEQCPSGATVVVTHSAVLTYLDPPAREAVIGQLSTAGVHRLGAEALDVLPDVTRQLPRGVDTQGQFVMSLDGKAIALAQGHGRTLHWL